MSEEEALNIIHKRCDAIELNLGLAINYMREIATIIGARERLAKIDREFEGRGLVPSQETTQQ